MNCSSSHLRRFLLLLAACALSISAAKAEEVGARWGTEERERSYYPIVNIPIPQGLVIEAGAFCVLPDGRVAIGTRHGEIYILSGIDALTQRQPTSGGLARRAALCWIQTSKAGKKPAASAWETPV